IATASGVVSGYAGLLVSFHTGVASGPAIILVAGALYVTSLLFGRVGGLVRQVLPRRHLEAGSGKTSHVAPATGNGRVRGARDGWSGGRARTAQGAGELLDPRRFRQKRRR